MRQQRSCKQLAVKSLRPEADVLQDPRAAHGEFVTHGAASTNRVLLVGNSVVETGKQGHVHLRPPASLDNWARSQRYGTPHIEDRAPVNTANRFSVPVESREL